MIGNVKLILILKLIYLIFAVATVILTLILNSSKIPYSNKSFLI